MVNESFPKLCVDTPSCCLRISYKEQAKVQINKFKTTQLSAIISSRTSGSTTKSAVLKENTKHIML
jgi:hypothetical protein